MGRSGTGGSGDIMYIFTGLKPKTNYIVRVFNGGLLLINRIRD